MQQLQAILQGQFSLQQVDVQLLLTLAEQYTQPASPEFQSLEMAINLVLARYLEQALEHI